MKKWSALLGAELLTWPSVTSRLMFGMTAFYCKGAIFVALPRTKCFETENSVAFKLPNVSPRMGKMLEADPRSRISPALRPDANWIRFELASDEDLAGALKWFDIAYHACSSRSKSKR